MYMNYHKYKSRSKKPEDKSDSKRGSEPITSHSEKENLACTERLAYKYNKNIFGKLKKK